MAFPTLVITAGFFNEAFVTHPDSQVMQTGLLLALSIVLMIRDRDFFFKRELKELAIRS